MRLRPGSTPWLLAHEARLKWRGMGRTSRLWTVGLLGLLMAGLAALGVLADFVLDRTELEVTRQTLLYTDAGLLLVFTLMLSQTLSSAAAAFFSRRDLDLLLSSPLPASRVLAARCLALAVSAALIPLIIVTPPALTVAVLGRPEWLASPLLVGGLGLLATTVGLWLAMGLFALIGPARTRTAAQILSAFTGAAFFLLSQSVNWLPDGARERLLRRLAAFTGSPLFDPGAPLAWPAQALLGDLPAAAGVFGASAILFGLTTAALGRRFAANAAAGAGREAGGAKPARGGRWAFSSGPFQATVRKEIRLLARDPALISQVFLRVLYLIPLLFVVLRNGGGGTAAALAAAVAGVVFVTGQLAGSLAWITISTEDSPDLLASAPAGVRLLRRAKLAAAMLPIAALLTGPLLALLYLSPSAGLIAGAACAGAALSSGLVRLWYAKPAKRADFNKREKGGGFLVNLAEVLMGFGWSTAAYLGVRFGLWGLIPAAAVLLLLLVIRRPTPAYVYG